jgi:AraC family transcriptional regulator
MAYIAIQRIPAVKWASKEVIYHSLTRARAHLARRYREKVVLKDAAIEAAMSPFHFQRLFRALYEESPAEFVMRIRLAEARRRLRFGREPIGQIAEDLGFCNPSALSRHFSCRFGITPREFRKKTQASVLGQTAQSGHGHQGQRDDLLHSRFGSGG